MAEICDTYYEWVEETIVTPIQRTGERMEEHCKEYPWYDPRGWFCWLVRIIFTFIEYVVEVIGKWVPYVVCVVVSPVINALGFVLRIITSIPIIGRLIGWAFKGISEALSAILSIPDMVLRLIGVRIMKRLHVCMIVLNDENGRPVTTLQKLQPTIDLARVIFKARANIDFVVHTHFMPEGLKNEQMDASTDAGAWWEELWLNGSYYELLADRECFDSSFQRVTGIWAPLVAIVVRRIEGANGASLGPVTSYITLAANYPDVDKSALAHETGHACWLVLHSDEKKNLMYAHADRKNVLNSLEDLELSNLQVTLLRASRHVTWF
jgi:hypothetical protein